MRRWCNTFAKRDWEETASLGGQDSKPLRSNSSNNFSCLCFTVILALAFHSHGFLLMPLSNWSAQGGLVIVWLQLPLPLGSSSSESGDMLYYFSPPQQYSYCHCTTLYKCSVLSDPRVRIHIPHVGPKSSHWSTLQCEWSTSLHVWHGMRRHQWSWYPWW